MKTLVLKEPGKFAVGNLPEPGPVGVGEALVQVHRVGVCGTDLHAFRGRQPFFSYPRILGHELGVEVMAIGSGVTNIHVGARCAVEPYLNCGHCIACRRCKPNCCTELKVIGVHIDGGLRERFVIPAAKLHSSTILTYDQLALVETLGIGAHAVARAALEPNETVAIIGAGPIGLAVLQFVRAKGCRAIVVDVATSRLAFCRSKMGVKETDLIDSSKSDVVAELIRLNNGELPTAIFDATGNAHSMTASFNFPAPGGRLIFVGLFDGELTFNDPNFHRRELTVLASRNSRPNDFVEIIKMLEAHIISTAPWITHRSSLEDAAHQFETWIRPESETLKAMITVSE